MIPHNIVRSSIFAGSRPHGEMSWRVLPCVLLCFLLVAVFGADEAHAQRRHRRRRHHAGHAQTKPKAPASPTKGDSATPTPASIPDPDTEPTHAGPAGPAESNLGDELGDAAPASGGASAGKAGARVHEKGKAQVFDFTGLNLSGSERKPQLLYFLDRAQEELKRASLERRSFIPEMVRSLGEESL